MGIPAQRVESASFAMVAWLDEIVARHPGWSAGATPLQVQLFNSNNAHSEFFHHLSALQADDGEVREIYWHALVHGFKGQYYFENGDSGELGKLKELHGQQLPVPPLALGTLAAERITPQPYGAPDPPGPRVPERRERALLRAAGALALLIPLVYLLGSMLNGPREAPPTLAPAHRAAAAELRLRRPRCHRGRRRRGTRERLRLAAAGHGARGARGARHAGRERGELRSCSCASGRTARSSPS